MNDLELAEEIERDLEAGKVDWWKFASVEKRQQIIAALRRGHELDQTYIVDGRGMRLCDCPNESKCQRGFQRTLATAEFSRCLLPIDHRQFNWFRCSFTKRPPSGEMTEERIDELWKRAMTEAADHFNGFLQAGMVPNFKHPENLTLPQRFAILLLSAAEAEGRKS